MFYCDDCKTKNNWPEAIAFKSHGNCEVCGENRICHDVPSKHLPMPPREDGAEHTPGEWVKSKRTDGRFTDFFIESNGQYVAAVPQQAQHPGQSEVNANLIAAAPNLLAELERLVMYYEPQAQPHRHEEIAKLRDAKAAIAKAKGE